MSAVKALVTLLMLSRLCYFVCLRVVGCHCEFLAWWQRSPRKEEGPTGVQAAGGGCKQRPLSRATGQASIDSSVSEQRERERFELKYYDSQRRASV